MRGARLEEWPRTPPSSPVHTRHELNRAARRRGHRAGRPARDRRVVERGQELAAELGGAAARGVDDGVPVPVVPPETVGWLNAFRNSPRNSAFTRCVMSTRLMALRSTNTNF